MNLDTETMARQVAELQAAYKQAKAADDAWQAALNALYGSQAGAARYDERGYATPELAALKRAYVAASATRLA